jgi:hypothetical protein
MKKLLIVLMVVAMASFLFVGCIPGLTPDPVPDPIPDPVPTMEANVDAVLTVIDEVDCIVWSIENIGSVNIFKYEITFDVYYPMIAKDNVILEVTGYALGVGEKDEGLLELLPYDTPDTVSVSWELFD